jgi:hypothetical protein
MSCTVNTNKEMKSVDIVPGTDEAAFFIKIYQKKLQGKLQVVLSM